MAVTLSISITQNSQSIANNTSNVTVKVTAKWTYGSHNALGQCTGHITIDGTKYSYSGMSFNTGKTTSGSQVVMTKTVDVTHNDDGKKTLSCSASFNTRVSSGTISASGSKVLTTIARKSSLTVSNGTLGTSQTITVDRKSTSLTHSIKAVCGSSTLYIKADGTTSSTEVKHGDCSIPFTPPLSWASQNTTGTSLSVKYTITTYLDSKSIGSNAVTRTYSIPTSVKPSCSITVSDTTGYADTYGGYIEGVSKLQVSISATKSYGASISKYNVTANGATYTKSSFTTGVVIRGRTAINATVTDARGRSGTDSETITIHSYSAPSVSKLNVIRCNEDLTENDKGEYVRVKFSYSAVNVNSQNSVTYTLQYKKASDSSYTTIPASSITGVSNAFSVTDATCKFAADSGSSYDVKLVVSDNFKTTTKTTTASTAATIMNWKANGLGMAIGKVSEEDDVLDVAYTIRARKGLINDAGWTNLTLSSNFALYNGATANQPMYKVCGSVVTVTGVVSPKTAYTSSTDDVVIASGIPATYRPATNQVFICQGSQLNRWTCTVRTDGTVNISRYGTDAYASVPTNAWLTFSCTYQI